jgi:hypothetical protein
LCDQKAWRQQCQQSDTGIPAGEDRPGGGDGKLLEAAVNGLEALLLVF